MPTMKELIKILKRTKKKYEYDGGLNEKKYNNHFSVIYPNFFK